MTDGKKLPEHWLRGPVPGVPIALQPVAHALLQSVEEAGSAVEVLDARRLWVTPAGAASAGYHLLHMANSLDRLLTYARGESLSQQQRADLAVEQDPAPDTTAHELLERLRAATRHALAQLRSTSEDELDAPRAVGRLKHPSTVRGLLYHAGEHTTRHAGQISTTAILLRDPAAAGGDLEEHLLSREQEFWKGDADFYRQNLTDDSLMVFAEPIGVLTKEATVASIAGGARWAEVSFDHARLLRLGRDAVLLTYKADARRDDGSTYAALVSSAYVHTDRGWQLSFHQHTPGG
jgi:uncharacterized damage-inducible protein DinB